MSDFAQLTAENSKTRWNESDIFLIFENPISESLEIHWKIKFPFPVVPREEMSGTVRLEPNKTGTRIWTTALTTLPPSQRQAALDREIEIELQLFAGSVFLQDGIGSTLRELSKAIDFVAPWPQAA